jgi:peptidoglycan hydrolase-like protein with peptidoglycan-binding domain
MRYAGTMTNRSRALALALMISLGTAAPSAAHYGWRRARVTHAHLMRETQRALNHRGYDAGPIDGVPGPRTRYALAHFQRDQGIRPTGRLDRRTAAALRI